MSPIIPSLCNSWCTPLTFHLVLLTGGGAREKVFWRNYFFHCAFTRYEAGLSIDEIWSDQPPPPPTNDVAVEEAAEEEVVDFEPPESADVSSQQEDSTGESSELFVEEPQAAPTDSPTAEYEMVENDGGADDADAMDDAFGGEIDELEAEILRELED